VSEVIERRRFERALHDGVQQDLIALAVRLQLAENLLADDPVAAAALLEELRRDVHTTLAAVQALSAEIYPALLDAHGLGTALSGMPRVRVHDIGRYAQELEAAVYFCCLESEAEIDVYDEDGVLRIESQGAISPRFRELAEAAGAVVHDSAR
jgi:signal transduction histidine kinase